MNAQDELMQMKTKISNILPGGRGSGKKTHPPLIAPLRVKKNKAKQKPNKIEVYNG